MGENEIERRGVKEGHREIARKMVKGTERVKDSQIHDLMDYSNTARLLQIKEESQCDSENIIKENSPRAASLRQIYKIS